MAKTTAVKVSYRGFHNALVISIIINILIINPSLSLSLFLCLGFVYYLSSYRQIRLTHARVSRELDWVQQ